MIQQTFSIIKPDATERNITGKINAMIESAGLRIVAQKRIRMTPEKAREFYQEHQGKDFFDGLVECMTSAPIVVQVLQGEDAIAKYRQIMGKTNPAMADKDTIRGQFGLELPHNSVHGSDGEDSARREIALFFNPEEIVG